MTKYQLVPATNRKYWLETYPEWFPVFDTEDEAWDYYDEEADGLSDSGIRKVKVVEVTA